jgi:ribonuclease P protein component
LKKINILRRNEDYNRIIKEIKPYKYIDYIIYIERVDSKNYHFGFSVGKKIGNAVARNKIKRQLKNIIDQKTYQNNFNCIIMVGKGIINKSFEDKKTNLLDALEKLQIIKGDKHEEK